MLRHYTTDPEDGGRGKKPKHAGSLLQLEKARERACNLNEHSPADTVALDCHFQKIINLYCLKPPILQKYVMAAKGYF